MSSASAISGLSRSASRVGLITVMPLLPTALNRSCCRSENLTPAMGVQAVSWWTSPVRFLCVRLVCATVDPAALAEVTTQIKLRIRTRWVPWVLLFLKFICLVLFEARLAAVGGVETNMSDRASTPMVGIQEFSLRLRCRAAKADLASSEDVSEL